MSHWVEKARTQDFSLLVSIPRNHPDMAKAAEAGGADAVKVHINCKHPASGRLFGSFRTEQKKLEQTLKAVSLPVGIVPGAEEKISPIDELKNLYEMGFDFFDVFAHDMPLNYLNVPIGHMVCIDSRYSKPDVDAMAYSGVDVFEASIIPHEGYGKSVVFSDLMRWRQLTKNLQVPLLVSTQRKIKPSECEFLFHAGVRGIVIGVVVTGQTVKGVYETSRMFKQAIQALPPRGKDLQKCQKPVDIMPKTC